MRFATLDRHFTGVAVPVAALRSVESCGVGEFADLVPLGQWCREAGLDLIQLLPVNDTGGNSSPYSALSAFALHPLHIRLQNLPGAARYAKEISGFQTALGRFSYPRTHAFKLSLLERLFADNEQSIVADAAFALWREQNPWVIPYAVFTALRKENAQKPWWSWPNLGDPGPEQITAWWDSNPAQCLLHAWVQFEAEKQLAAASRSLSDMGVHLKGDLPILMSGDSADVWAYRRFFDLSAHAGAPPDMFSPDGQNWGFPVYDWEALARDDYRWWKERLGQAGKFFHAFRIDHVLGFFRIWRIARGELTGLLGRFSPSAPLTAADLQKLGFDKGRLQWLSLPHVSGTDLTAALGAQAPRVAEMYLRRIGAEDLYNLKPEIDGEQAIDRLAEPPEVKASLRSWHANRTLLEDGTGTFYPTWYREGTKGFQSLEEAERAALRGLIDQKRRESEETWERHGQKALAEMQGATDMLVCAEDLGDVPRCVPRVLSRLGILGLRILRWSRAYDSAPPGTPAPVIPPASYQPLSVCTPSVHDTSTIRGWWEEDAGERDLFFRALGGKGDCPTRMTVGLLESIVRQCRGAGSLLTILQLQDLLDLDEGLWAADPRTDRINIPGTVSETNWTWRMPLSLEALRARAPLSTRIRAIMEAR
jgi:4-alpha-glucanotransferase